MHVNVKSVADQIKNDLYSVEFMMGRNAGKWESEERIMLMIALIFFLLFFEENQNTRMLSEIQDKEVKYL